MPMLQRLGVLVVVIASLAGLEWWSVNQLYGGAKFAGPILGAATVVLLVLLYALLKKQVANWPSAVIAVLTAVVELIFSVALISSLSAIAVLLLPFSISSSLMKDDAATDLIIFAMLGLGLMVAARGWRMYSAEKLHVAKAELEKEQAKLQVVERERELARAELTVLRAQIEPHFLWNTLAHVQYLARKNPPDAERMTGHLIRFLRSAVPQMRGNMTTMGAEIDSVSAYLELMKIRMGSRLSVEVRMESALHDVPFPPLMIQTLVENAIKHGLEPKVGPVSLTVSAQSSADGLGVVVEVADSGVGLQSAPETQGTGMGLKSVRERLQLIYGAEAKLEISGFESGGVVARIQIPKVSIE